jgi:hypothetical protein
VVARRRAREYKRECKEGGRAKSTVNDVKEGKNRLAHLPSLLNDLQLIFLTFREET